MRNFLPSKTIIGILPAICFAISVAILVYISPAMAENAVENALDRDLTFRGQGRANLCYAFAEEQLLKDFICTANGAGDCEHNSIQWKLSIFDIAKAHQDNWIKGRGSQSIRGSFAVDLLTNGASDVLPFEELGISSVSASRCTIEKEIFYLNRSQETNPNRLELAEYIKELYPKFKTGSPLPQLDKFPLAVRSAFQVLAMLAHGAESADDFLERVEIYRSCSEKIEIPKFSIQSKTFSNPLDISMLINRLLKENKSVYAGVCAEVLKDEKDDGSKCARHAVVIKSVRNGPCLQRRCSKEVRLVDSAFFSRRPRNADGSVWIAESVLIIAMRKSSKDFEQIRSSALKSSKVDTTGLGIAVRDFIKAQVQADHTTNVKAKSLELMNAIAAQFQTDATNKRFIELLISRVAQLKLETAQDLDQIPVAIQESMEAAVNANVMSLAGNGIVWLEMVAPSVIKK